MPPGPSPTITPADSAAPAPPTHPEAIRTGHHGRPPHPNALNAPPASHPGNALGRPRNNPPDEEDPPEQTATTTFTLHVFKTTPE